MRRPTVPDADQEIGVRHPVLSHGFVVLVDYMGDDAAIVQAARVSYGQGTKSVRDDRGLIRYLMRHRHTTPFEMVELKFLVRLPIFVARQWIRHRTACLAAGTKVVFDRPGTSRRGSRQAFPLSIEETWRRFQPTRSPRASTPRNRYVRRDRIRRMLLRQLDEDSRVFRHTHVLDVTRNGVKPVFRLRLDDGKSIDCTADHRFLFDDGWATLGQRTGLHEENGRAVWNPGEYQVVVNGAEMALPALYQDRAWLEREYVQRSRPLRDVAEACGVLPETVAQWARRFNLPRPSLNPPRYAKRDSFSSLRSQRVRRGWTRAVPEDGCEPYASKGAGDHWTGQLGDHRRVRLHAHHIVPARADVSTARDPSDLAPLYDESHPEVPQNEPAYVERLGGPAVEEAWRTSLRVGRNRLTVARYARVEGFEFLGNRMTYDLEVEGPHHNFVANGIVTHNSVNEYSARYSIVPDEYEVPDEEEVRHQSTRNRQGRGEALPKDVVDRFRNDLERVSNEAYAAYARALEDGVARETARLLLPVAYYTQWYWKCNLWNLFHFLSLRLDPHAQEEIRLYAAELARITRLVVPIAYEAFEEFTLAGLSLSRREQVAVRALLEGKTPEAACQAAGLPLTREDGKPMTSGEGVEFLEKLTRLRSSE